MMSLSSTFKRDIAIFDIRICGDFTTSEILDFRDIFT